MTDKILKYWTALVVCIFFFMIYATFPRNNNLEPVKITGSRTTGISTKAKEKPEVSSDECKKYASKELIELKKNQIMYNRWLGSESPESRFEKVKNTIEMIEGFPKTTDEECQFLLSVIYGESYGSSSATVRYTARAVINSVIHYYSMGFSVMEILNNHNRYSCVDDESSQVWYGHNPVGYDQVTVSDFLLDIEYSVVDPDNPVKGYYCFYAFQEADSYKEAYESLINAGYPEQTARENAIKAFAEYNNISHYVVGGAHFFYDEKEWTVIQ